MHLKRNYSRQRQQIFLFVNASSPTMTHSLRYAASAQNFLCDVATGQWHYHQLFPVSRLCSKLQLRPSFCGHSPYRFWLQTHNNDLYPFLEAFAKLRKTTISFDLSVRPSVCIEHIGSHKTHFHEILYLYIFEKLLRQLKFN